jgi:hypothetical protein
MANNVVIAIIAASGVVISAICVLGGAIFAYVASNRTLDRRFDGVDKRLDKIDHTLELIQADMKMWVEQIFKIKAHIKLN